MASAMGIEALVDELQAHWASLAPQFPGVQHVWVIAIDLTNQGFGAKMAAIKRSNGLRGTRQLGRYVLSHRAPRLTTLNFN